MKTILSLAGSSWTFFEPKSSKWLSARVPGCIHTDLREHNLIPDPFWGSNETGLQWIEEQDWKYRLEFELSEAQLASEHLELVADSLDTVATIKLNGHEIGKTANMFVGYRFSIKKAARKGKNTLEIAFGSPMEYIRDRHDIHNVKEWNDPVGGSSVIRKQQCSFGWDWGPRFATSGIAGDIRVEGWNANRIESVKVRQAHGEGSVVVFAEAALAIPDEEAKLIYKLSFEGDQVAETCTGEITICNPHLWWPNGLGTQPLYTVEVELQDASSQPLDSWKGKIGLRTITLDCHPDEFGESFQFLVNGKAVFAKGANWIPAHSFINEATPEFYRNLLGSAVRGNMNMIRVWGGGIYETETFYNLCDELGLMVWQDFMFACALYPGTEEFLTLVQAEAEFQIKRLSHRASLALWCGNNELEQMSDAILATPQRKLAYDEIFYKLLPEAVEKFDGITAYWPSSPHNPEGYEKGHNNENAGDSHFWEVWHARKPVKLYETKKFRFCSEFGMQSYSSPEVAATFCPPEEFNVFSPAMENHQKNCAGNQIILDYVSRLYRFPKDYAALAYLSQLNQAYCMKIGIEHFRRSMPRTMGALYWQLNDCWPVFSWSSIEFGGKWKALHWAAKRFFAPALISAHVHGEETLQTGNTVVNQIDQIDLYTVYDAPDSAQGTAGWTLCNLDGRILEKGEKPVELKFGQSVIQFTLSAKSWIEKYGPRNLYLRIHLEIGGEVVSQDTVFLTAPRFINFDRAPIQTSIAQVAPGAFELELSSIVFHHQMEWNLQGIATEGSANFFDIYPGELAKVKISCDPTLGLERIQSALTVRSLADSYS